MATDNNSKTAIKYTAPVAGRVVVVGLGLTGLSVLRFLSRFDLDLRVIDSRANPPGLAELQDELPAVPSQFGPFDTEWLCAADVLVVSPGISIAEPAIAAAAANNVEIIGDIELFARLAKAPIVAITGSNGKSTVTSLLGELVNAAGKTALLGGNIGRPALDLLNDPIADVYVLELSSFQLETTRSLQAKAAVVLNISPDHMDRYDSLDAYAAAKSVIYQGCERALINMDDKRVVAMMPEAIGFGLGEPNSQQSWGRATREGKAWLMHDDQALIDTKELRVAGSHNHANALAALALGEAIGCDVQKMVAALPSFKGLAHRSVVVAEHDGVLWIDDSKATNVGATIAAIEGIADDANALILIAGGQAKDQDFSPLLGALQRVKAVLLIGEDADLLANVLTGEVEIHHCETLVNAVTKANDLATDGDTVLLSPACASFDQFDGFAERGEAFARLVKGQSS